MRGILQAANYLLGITICFLSYTSCVIFQPLPLAPPVRSDSLPVQARIKLSDLNGDYKIYSDDTSRHDLAYALTYFRPYKVKKSAQENGFVRLQAVSDKRIDATVFIDGIQKKTKKLKGKVTDSYFYFHNNRYSFSIIFLVYEKQSNRLFLSKTGDLVLDTQAGGLGFLIFLPIPLSGATDGRYHLQFNRKK